jgi:hypothetical protein
MCKASQSVLMAGLFFYSVSSWGQSNACDLTSDGKVDGSDVQAAINMSLSLSPCTANIYGAGVCNVVVVQRVINASLGGTCLTGTGTIAHSVSLAWTASTSPNVTAYKIYRGTTSGGPYSLVSNLGVATSFTDNNVVSGQTYYYVVTALDSTSAESSYSNQAQAVIPTP